jgi:hypothetical protein
VLQLHTLQLILRPSFLKDLDILNICSFVHQCNTFTFYFLLIVDMFRPHTAIFRCYSIVPRSCCSVMPIFAYVMLPAMCFSWCCAYVSCPSVNYVILCFVSNFVKKLLYLCVYTCGINYCVVVLIVRIILLSLRPPCWLFTWIYFVMCVSAKKNIYWRRITRMNKLRTWYVVQYLH